MNITAFDSNDLNCDNKLCITTFNNLTERIEEFAVSIKAENEFGSSDLVIYPFSIGMSLYSQTIMHCNEILIFNHIGHQLQLNFMSNLFVVNHQLFGRCTAQFSGLTRCIIQYTTDSMFRNLSVEAVALPDTQISLLQAPIPGKTYYILFAVLVNNTFQITDRFAFSFSAAIGKV